MDITYPYYIIRTQYVMSINESIRKHPLVACTPYSTTSERARKRRRRRRRRHWCGVLSPSNRRRRLRHLRPSRANAARPIIAHHSLHGEHLRDPGRARPPPPRGKERRGEEMGAEKRRQRRKLAAYSSFSTFRACFHWRRVSS